LTNKKKLILNYYTLIHLGSGGNGNGMGGGDVCGGGTGCIANLPLEFEELYAGLGGLNAEPGTGGIGEVGGNLGGPAGIGVDGDDCEANPLWREVGIIFNFSPLDRLDILCGRYTA
jgi:hypothetical protein